MHPGGVAAAGDSRYDGLVWRTSDDSSHHREATAEIDAETSDTDTSADSHFFGTAARPDGDRAPDWLPVERNPSLASLSYLFVRTVACRAADKFGELLSLVVGLLVVCALVGAIGASMPVSAPASMALVMRRNRTSAIAALAYAYGLEPYMPRVNFPSDLDKAADMSAAGWLATLAAVVLAGVLTQQAQRLTCAIMRWLGVAALRAVVDLDNGLVLTRAYWASKVRVAWRLAKHLATMAVMGGLMISLTSFLVHVSPVGGSPTHRQLNRAAQIMDTAPLLRLGEGRRMLDAFTVSNFKVSVSVAPSSFLSSFDVFEMAESLGLEATYDLNDAREGGWGSSIDFGNNNASDALTARRKYAHAYKSMSLNIWDSGANRGNFTSLK